MMHTGKSKSLNSMLQLRFCCVLILFIGSASPNIAQGLSVYSIQNMSFGAFSQGAGGGTISILTDGTRQTTGSVMLLNLGVQYYEALFEIEAPAGTIVSILNSPDVQLSSSNNGKMSLHINSFSPSLPFSTTIPPPGRNVLKVGGTLTVGNAASNPPGSYTGNILITFNQE